MSAPAGLDLACTADTVAWVALDRPELALHARIYGRGHDSSRISSLAVSLWTEDGTRPPVRDDPAWALSWSSIEHLPQPGDDLIGGVHGHEVAAGDEMKLAVR